MRGLDWSNERYTRLHHRDTPAWLLLSYGTRCLWLQLLRKMDRSGVIGLDETAMPFESVAAMLPGSNPEHVERQLKQLIDRKWLVHNRERNCLVDAEFQARDETPMSDAQRQRESRARRREQALSQNVTHPSQNVTDPSRAVTLSHAESRAVTPSLPSPPPPAQTEAPAAPARGEPKTPQQQRVDAVLRVYDDAGINGKARPKGGVCAKWIALYRNAGATVGNLTHDLGALQGQGHLDKGTSYVFGVLQSTLRRGEAGKFGEAGGPKARPAPRTRAHRKWIPPEDRPNA